MPNHVVTRITFSEDRYQEIFDRITTLREKTEHRDAQVEVDFNKLIPMPEELLVTSDGLVMNLTNKFTMQYPITRLVAELKKADEKTIDNFCLAVKNLNKLGHADWYNWSIENWGTKWNAYSCEFDFPTIKFETAWALPDPIIQKLSETFPDAWMLVEYADEDYGSNLGRFNILNGKRNALDIPEPLDEWAMRMHGHDDASIEEYRREQAE